MCRDPGWRGLRGQEWLVGELSVHSYAQMILKCNYSRIWNGSECAIGAHCISCELHHWFVRCGVVIASGRSVGRWQPVLRSGRVAFCGAKSRGGPGGLSRWRRVALAVSGNNMNLCELYWRLL